MSLPNELMEMIYNEATWSVRSQLRRTCRFFKTLPQNKSKRLLEVQKRLLLGPVIYDGDDELEDFSHQLDLGGKYTICHIRYSDGWEYSIWDNEGQEFSWG
jgi:hypothetical protein